ncbi:PTS sugar transporter subunit IIB [Paraliobacillus salinarum]|uniref:PTS sugar transporter subunit IIB n=1 Tax=Paraliobacillus salinarum TaxID=1158996 RepID=UPI0024838E2F|nr:hypothetical protein [Paraliobacillus salinarum]
MLICANGMSTGLLVKKIEKWAMNNQPDLEVKAYGINSYQENYENYDCILIGPQISYKLEEIKGVIGSKPITVIESVDYALGNVDNIMKQVDTIIK